MRALLKNLIKHFDDILKNLNDFPFGQVLIKGIKEDWDITLILMLSFFLIWILYNRNKVNKKWFL